jgi:hypothetical protein
MTKFALYVLSAFLLVGASAPAVAASVSPVSVPKYCCRGGHGGGGSRGGSRSRGSGYRSRSYGTRTRSYSGRGTTPRTPRVSTYRSPGLSSLHAPRATTTHTYALPRSARVHAPGERDTRGRLERSSAAKSAFERQTGHGGGWQGHVVDHIVPLACGGADAPSNMQWQTTADGKAKDPVERRGCATARRR